MPAADDLSQIDREMWLRERDKREYAERALMVEAESYQQNLARVEAERDAVQKALRYWRIVGGWTSAALVAEVIINLLLLTKTWR